MREAKPPANKSRKKKLREQLGSNLVPTLNPVHSDSDTGSFLHSAGTNKEPYKDLKKEHLSVFDSGSSEEIKPDCQTIGPDPGSPEWQEQNRQQRADSEASLDSVEAQFSNALKTITPSEFSKLLVELNTQQPSADLIKLINNPEQSFKEAQAFLAGKTILFTEAAYLRGALSKNPNALDPKATQTEKSRRQTKFDKENTQELIKESVRAREQSTAPAKCVHNKSLVSCVPCIKANQDTLVKAL